MSSEVTSQCWTLRALPNWENPDAVIIQESGEQIAKLTPLLHPSEAKEYGRLMSAAPELLEACRWALCHLTDGKEGQPCMSSNGLLDELRQAIAKATTGGQP